MPVEENKTIEARFIMDEAYRKLRLSVMQYVNPKVYYHWIWAIVGLIMGVVYRVMFDWELLSIVLISISAFVLIIAVNRWRQARRDFYDSPMAGAEAIWQFSQDGIDLYAGENHIEVPWKNVSRIESTPLGLVIFTHPKLFQLVPTSAFSSAEEVDTVMIMFSGAKETVD